MISQKESGPGSTGITCPRCHSALSLDSDPLQVRCLHQHLHTLEELLHRDFPKGDDARKDLPPSLLRIWEHQALMLRELSASALRNGHALIAADFREAATRIEGWMSSLSSLMSRRAAAMDLPD